MVARPSVSNLKFFKIELAPFLFPNAQQKGSRLRLGVWGLGVDAKSVRSVRKRPQASTAENVAKRRTVVTVGLALVFASQKCQPSQGSENCRRFWTRVASQKCQQSQGSGGAWS